MNHQGDLKMNNEEIIQNQVNAYNERNLEKLCGFYHDNVQIIDFNINEIILEGMDAFHKRYKDRFVNSPNLNCLIQSRISYNNFVIDKELIEGFMGNTTSEAIVIYELEKEKILRVWIMS